jgi:hypothetical protein
MSLAVLTDCCSLVGCVCRLPVPSFTNRLRWSTIDESRLAVAQPANMIMDQIACTITWKPPLIPGGALYATQMFIESVRQPRAR